MTDLCKLAKKKRVEALLLAKYGALLHNLGKVSSQFLKHQLNIDCPNFLYQHILGLIDSHCPIPTSLWDKCPNLSHSDILDPATKQALSGNSFRLPYPFDDREYVPGDLIEYLGQKEPWYKTEPNQELGILYLFPNGSRLTHLMNRAHRGASGGEKEDIYTKQQSPEHDLYHATPFGWERPAPGIFDVDDVRLQVERVIQNHLNKRPITSEFSKGLFPHLSMVIADTQRPFNDVTVWDIGHIGMAFLITQAVSHILMRRPLEHAELVKIEKSNTLFWSVLSIRTDGLKYLAEAPALADLRVRKSQLDKALKRIQLSLEKDCLAIQVYRDENGSLFIFPGSGCLSESMLRTIKPKLNPLIEIDGHKLDVKLSPASLVSHPKDKGGKYIGEFIREELGKNLVDRMDPIYIAQAWAEPSLHAEICSACGVRPQGYGAKTVTSYMDNPDYYSNKARLRNLCCLCMHRRSGVAERWASRIHLGIDKGTVWIDEAADDKGRVALIVGQFSIDPFMQSMFYPCKKASRTEREFHHQVEWIENSPAAESSIEINRKGRFMWTGTALVGSSKLGACQTPNLKIHNHAKDVTLKKIESDSYGDIFLEINEELNTDTVKIMGADFFVANSHRLKATNEAKEKVKSSILWHDDCSSFYFWVREVREKTIFKTKGKAAENDSFARLRRIWETTQEFWLDVCPTDKAKNIQKSLVSETVGMAGARLEIRGTTRQRNGAYTPDPYHAYDLVLPNSIKLSVSWDPETDRSMEPKGRFISIDNLIYLVSLAGEKVPSKENEGEDVHRWAAERTKDLINGTLKIEEATGYGGKAKEWGEIEVDCINIIPNSQYTPAIPILAEPRTFMALVPADKALKVVEEIKAKYEREMGKVRNRLPLHLGIVYAHRRTPLRAILDAGRKMLDRKLIGDVGAWIVTGDVTEKSGMLPDKAAYLSEGSNQFTKWYPVGLKHLEMNRELVWHIPSVMGDGTTPDNWYPYVFWSQDKDGKTEPANATILRSRYFKSRNPWKEASSESGWLVHAGELKEGDLIYFTAATLDFQWLDSAGRRFEIAYDEHGKRFNIPRRPYLLDEIESLNEIWQTLSNHLTKNQIYILRDLIEAKREDWKVKTANPEREDVFWRFCRNALANAQWTKGKKDRREDRLPWESEEKDRKDWLDQWADYAVRGWITDAIEIYLQIMKEEV